MSEIGGPYKTSVSYTHPRVFSEVFIDGGTIVVAFSDDLHQVIRFTKMMLYNTFGSSDLSPGTF